MWKQLWDFEIGHRSVTLLRNPVRPREELVSHAKLKNVRKSV